jgi:hypothetical protein
MAELTRERIDAEHFVARYAQGKLAGLDLEAFEEYCLLHPEIAEQVQTDRALIEGLRVVEPGQSSRWPIYALAAGVAVIAVGLAVWTAVGNRDAPGALYAISDALPTHGQLSDSLRVVRVRDEAAQVLPIGADVTAVSLEIEPSNTRGVSSLDVTLEVEHAGEWTQRGARSNIAVDPDRETVRIVVDISNIESTHWHIHLKGGGKADDFYLRLERSANRAP